MVDTPEGKGCWAKPSGSPAPTCGFKSRSRNHATLYECRECGRIGNTDDLNRCSLDAYADFDDYDEFCPCGSDDLKFLRDPDESDI